MADESLHVILEDEAGNEREYELVGTFGLDDREYMALLPAGGGEAGEVMLTGFHGDSDDRIVFDPITDDETYRRVAEAFEDIFNGRIEQEEYYIEETDDEPPADDLTEDDGDYCYQDRDGNLFIYGEDGSIIYLNEYGEPIEKERKEPEGDNEGT